MKLRWHHALILAVTALSSNAGAIDTAENTLRNVLQTIGITTQIQLMEELVVEASRKHTTRCSTSEPSTSIPSFSEESIIFDSVRDFNHSSNLDSLLLWFNSPLADKIHSAEKTPIDSEQFIAAVPQIKQDQQRFQTIKNIIRDTRTVDFIVLLGTEIEYAGLLHSGCIEKAETLTPGTKNFERRLADSTRSDTALTATLIEGDVTLELAYLLRELTDGELKRYADFTRSANAQSFYTALINSLEKSFRRASDRIAFQHTHSALDY